MRRAAMPRRSVVLAVAAALVLVVGTWAILAPRLAAPPSLHDVAVVPFVDLSEGGDNARLAAVFTDALITDLARLGGGRVASRTAVESGLRSGLDSQAIARQLRVGSLVEGTVERDGDRVTITVRVVNAQDGSVVWADLLEGESDSLTVLRQDLAARVREVLATG
jgi:TolB-like protein